MKCSHLLPLILSLSLASTAQAQNKDPVFKAMEAEMARAMGELQLEGAAKPYRVDYAVIDTDIVEVRGIAGAVTGSDRELRRRISVDVRVGDYKLDSSTRGGGFSMFGHGDSAVPIEDDTVALRRAFWLQTDQAYKNALKSMSRKEAWMRNRTEDKEEQRDDYTPSGPIVVSDPPPTLVADQATMEDLARTLSRILRESPALSSGGVMVTASRLRRRYLDTEGNRTDAGHLQARLIVSAGAMAEDGTTVADAIDFLAPTMAELPEEKVLVEETRALVKRLEALSKAPVVEDYDGPVLFEGESAGQAMRFFLARNLSGTPPPRASMAFGDKGGSFARKMNRPVMPKGWKVHDDPTLKAWKGEPLMGHYTVDHEGVSPRKVELIKDGRLQAMLMSRIPSKHHPVSDGHGRGSLLGAVAGHPGNLIVQAPRGRTDAALRKELLRLANEEGYDYALVVLRMADDAVSATGVHDLPPIMGPGFPQPLRVIKLKADGSEELVRGVSFQHIIDRNLREITAVGKDPVVYNYLSPGVSEGSSFFSFGPDPALSIPTSIVAPAFILPHVDVVPNKGDSRKKPLVPRP